MKTVLQSKKECWVCGTTIDLHDHHIFYGTANRKISEKRGLKVWLCGKDHNLSKAGVHFNKELDTALKQFAQTYYEEHIGTRSQFREEFRKSYL